MTDKLLNYVYSVEGNELHYNEGEKDITAPGGIYRGANPNAAIFKYIDDIARSIGVFSPSNTWGKQTIHTLNKYLDKSRIDILVKDFYKNYLKTARLELFHPVNRIVIYNLFMNTKRGTWIAVQDSIRDLVALGIVDIPEDMISISDGAFGRKTAYGLEVIAKQNKDVQYAFRFALTSNAKTYYAKLVARNPDKYFQWLEGWINRVDNIETTNIEV